jgi:hypothetical protein
MSFGCDYGTDDYFFPNDTVLANADMLGQVSLKQIRRRTAKLSTNVRSADPSGTT